MAKVLQLLGLLILPPRIATAADGTASVILTLSSPGGRFEIEIAGPNAAYAARLTPNSTIGIADRLVQVIDQTTRVARVEIWPAPVEAILRAHTLQAAS